MPILNPVQVKGGGLRKSSSAAPFTGKSAAAAIPVLSPTIAALTIKILFIERPIRCLVSPASSACSEPPLRRNDYCTRRLTQLEAGNHLLDRFRRDEFRGRTGVHADKESHSQLRIKCRRSYHSAPRAQADVAVSNGQAD